jgi:hypothetical protein
MSVNNNFSVVGVSRQFGKLKIRMANDRAWREFMLTKEGHVDIQLLDLGTVMPKERAIELAMAATAIQEDGSLAPVFGEEAQEVFRAYLISKGIIERPKKRRGRPAKAEAEAVTAEAVEPQVEEPAADEAAEAPAEEPAEVTVTLDDMPRRDERGRLLSRAAREAMLAERLGAAEEVA